MICAIWTSSWRNTVADLRVVTVNTGKCDGEYRARIDLMSSQLGELAPDVILLQECFAAVDGSADTLRALAADLGMHATWAPARRKKRAFESREIESDSGLGILTRVPLAETQAVQLPADPRDGERLAQFGLLEVEDAVVLLANIHLTHLRDSGDLRRDQLATVLAHPWLSRTDVTARLICGDFNVKPPQVHDMIRVIGGGWDICDTYRLGQGEEPHTSLAPRGDGRGEPRVIDYILSVEADSNSHPRCIDSAVVLNRRDPTRRFYPSDHFGVATTLILREAGTQK